MGQPPLRRACDRCHSQKLLCQREEQEDCARCVKANKICTTSPSLRTKRNREPDESELSLLQEERYSTAGRMATSNGRTQGLSSNDRRDSVLDEQLDAWLPSTSPHRVHSQHLDDVIDWSPTQAALRSNHTQQKDKSIPFNHWPFVFGNEQAMTHFAHDMNSINLFDFNLTADTVGKAMDNSLDNNVSQSEKPYEGDQAKQSGNDSSGSSPLGIARSQPTDHHEGTVPVRDPSVNPADIGKWLPTLAELNVKLYNQAKKSTDSQDTTLNPAHDSLSASSLILDEALGLFLQFLELLKQTQGKGEALQGGSSGGHAFSFDASSTPEVPSSPSLMTIFADPGSVLMILSCYIRILETCNGALETIYTALANGLPSKLQQIQMLEITVGTNRLDSKYPLVKLRIMMELMESLLDCMRVSLAPQHKSGADEGHQSKKDLEVSCHAFMQEYPETTQKLVFSLEKTAGDRMKSIRAETRRLQIRGTIL
ncbi:hypothetical protein F4778DRAFT_722795 [Xylariomycetidae sp. FL2044]|nr:hypothetical protein F4778DRAFT_722795 [Xylariomycetidae sp. FL2044]